MCLAIAPNSQCSNSLFARLWSRFSSTPFRLFTFAALFHLCIGVAISVYSQHAGAKINADVLLLGWVYGVLALPIFGFLMTWLPENYALSPVHYGRYSSVYLLMMLSLLMLEAGAISRYQWLLSGMWLFVPAWVLAVQGMWQLHVWIKSSATRYTRLLLLLLMLNAALLVLGVAAYSIDLPIVAFVSLLSLYIVWPIILLLTVIFIIKTPAAGRIISV